MTSQPSDYFKDTIQVLFSACGDKEESVNNAVIKSLTKIASVYPNEVIEHFCEFYKNTAKVYHVQLGNIIKVLEQTCVNHMKIIKAELAPDLVNAMLRAMTQNADYQPTIQMGASAVLVALGYVHLDLVLQTLTKEITASSVPHYTIPHTLGTLAAVNTQIVVPFVKDILAKMLPLLTLVKVDGTKQAFAYAFGHFAVAVSEQIGDNVENDNITSIKDNFVVEFSIIFDVLYNQWLYSNEPKVSETVLEALGPISRLLSERKFDEIVNKFVISLLGLYRKTTINAYYVSQCISYILTPSPLNPKLILNDNVINSTNHTLFNLVVSEPDYDQPHTIKNHFEVLRCFDHMAGQFPEPTIEGLLHQCKNTQDKDRMKAVIVLTHLTTSSQLFIDRFASKFIAILKVMTNMEQGIKMKKLLVKAIVGLVYRNCITSGEDFGMVEFIIKNCGYEPLNVSKTDLDDLHDTCKSSLVLLCNSATNVRSQLRDLLLKAITVDDLTPSICTVSNCLTVLLQNNSEVSGEEQSAYVSENKTSPNLVFVRCLTHLVEPEKVERNKNLLTFLDEYAGDIHKNLKTSWVVEVERLLKYVEKYESVDEWHLMLLELLIAAVEQVNSNKWVENISMLLSQQIVSMKQPPIIKGMSLQYLALLSCHMSNAAVVEQVLKTIFLALKAIPMESVDYVSKAIGIASRKNGEYVLNELDGCYKEIEGKRGSKLLNFISSRHSRNEAEINVAKYAVIVSYGKVARECLDVHALARLGDNVTAVLLDILKANPPMELCRASVTTLFEISEALQPASHHNVVLRNRWQLLNAVLEQIYNPNLEKRNVMLYPVIVKASKGLTKLQKGILPEERNTILRVLFSNIFGVLSSFKEKYEVEENGDENDLLAKTLNDSLSLLHELIRELIIQSTCLSTIDDLVGLLVEWLRHENEEIRTASILIFQVILDAYIKNVKLNYETPSKFGQMGYLLGLIVPGIADSNFQVRLSTIECIKLIIQMQYLYEGHTIEPDDECLANLMLLHDRVQTKDMESIAEYSRSLSEWICEKLPHLHTMQFVESLLEGYEGEGRDPRSAGVSAALEGLFAQRGPDLYQSVERAVEALLESMERAGDGERKRAGEVELEGNGLLTPLASLARHHSNAVTAVLLAQRIPLKPCVIACWRHLAKDASLSAAILDNFLRLMNSSDLYEDPYHITENHIAALQPLTLISALGEMLQEPAMSDVCEEKFSDLFVMLYTTYACYIDAAPPAYSVPRSRGQERLGFVPNREAMRLSPAHITLDAFRAMLRRPAYAQLLAACTEDGAGSVHAMAVRLAGALAGAGEAGRAARLVPALSAAARRSPPPRRAAALDLAAALLAHRCNENPVLSETVIAMLNTGWKDEDDQVRATSLLGLANIAQLSVDHRAGAMPAALHALSQGVDAPPQRSAAANVPLAAIQGLCTLLCELELSSEYHRELVGISHKIRAFLSTECADLREHSIRLFGIIATKVNSEMFSEQAISALPCFLLRLCDPNEAVVRASKVTVVQVFSALGTERCAELCRRHLVAGGRLQPGAFLAALLRALSAERPEAPARCLAALAAASAHRDSAAPLLLDKLYAELYVLGKTHPSEAAVDGEVTRAVRARLLQLVKDNDPQVREHATSALANLCLCTSR